jgi:predicted dehydrogenase
LIKLMLVGCGLRGRSWARVVKGNPDCEITAYVDIAPEALNRIRKEYGDVPAYTDFHEAVKKADVDAAIVVTPPQYHHEQSITLLNQGLHLLVEKPLTEDYETSLEIVNLAEERNLNLTVGMQFRYMPVTQAYRNLYEKGEFGSPSFSQFSYIRTRNPMNYMGMILNQYCNDMSHTFLLEQAIHHLDLIRYVFQTDVESVQAYEWNPVDWEHNPYRQDPNVSMLLTLENGMHVNYLGTWISGNEGMSEGIDFRWRTDFQKGIIVQRDLFGEKGIYTASRMDYHLTHIDTGPIEPFFTDTVMLLEEFIDCLKNNRPPETSGRDHLKTLSAVLASIESSTTGKKIYIDKYMEKLSAERND